VHVETAIVKDEQGGNPTDLVHRALEPELSALLVLVLAGFQPEQADVLCAQQNHLPRVKVEPIVLCAGMHVPLSHVVQLVHIGAQDGVRFLHGGSAHDAELGYQRLDLVVDAEVGVASEHGDVTGHAVGAKDLKIELAVVAQINRGVLPELGQMQQAVLGREHLVAAVEFVQG